LHQQTAILDSTDRFGAELVADLVEAARSAAVSRSPSLS
jgi:hypothetical protein